MPYSPTIARDLLAECGISQPEAAAAIGFNKETLRHAINRGYMPKSKVRRNIREQITEYLRANKDVEEWLSRRSMTLADIWRPSSNKSAGIYPANHGDKVYRTRRHDLPAARPRLGREHKKLQRQLGRRKQIMENGYATLAAYGYNGSPFSEVRIPTADGSTLKRLFKMATEAKAMVSVIAPYGAGKTTAIETALDGLPCHPICLNLADKENMKIADIERALVRRLSQEPIARDRDTRALQVSRVVGEAGKIKPVVLIIEEAHVMHHSTLRALKRIREYDWMGRRPLLAVVLIGQFDKLKTANLAECHRGVRSDTYKLQGLAPSEARLYVNETVGECFEPEAVKALSELPDARNFLDLQEAIITLMQAGLSSGTKRVTVLDVFQAYGGGIKQLMDKYDIKLSQLAELTGEHNSTLSLVINNKPHTLSKEKEVAVKTAISDAIKTLTQQTGHKPHLKTAMSSQGGKQWEKTDQAKSHRGKNYQLAMSH